MTRAIHLLRRLLPLMAALALGCSVATLPASESAPLAGGPVTVPPDVAVPSPPPFPARTARCDERPFDATASLGPVFEHDIFVRDESRGIAASFLSGLAQIYSASGDVDPCDLFTNDGWTAAVAWDSRIGAADRHELAMIQGPILRVAFESGTYDLRERPPVVPLDIIFDIPSGATTTNLASRETLTSEKTERVGVHVDFVFDGDVWRADNVGPINEDYRQYTVLPTTPPPGPPCDGFSRDEPGTDFDEREQRAWCDEDGRGVEITRDQLVLLTRYPCNEGRAAILHLGQPLGSALDGLARSEYVRDPTGDFLTLAWLTEPYEGNATLPADAAYTGWTNGNVDLWISPTEVDEAMYIVRGDTVERWPRAAEYWGVIDCN